MMNAYRRTCALSITAVFSLSVLMLSAESIAVNEMEAVNQGKSAAEKKTEKKSWRSPESVEGAITTNAAEAKSLHDRGVTFIDVRNPRFYAEGHIPGAHHLDFKYDYDEASLASVADKDKPVVIYCSGVVFSRSYRASAEAVSWGYTSVHYFRGGIADWQDAGYPIEK